MKYQQILRIIVTYYPIIKDLKIKIKSKTKFNKKVFGCCITDINKEKWNYIKSNIRTKRITVHSIHIRNDLKNELFIFLHELSHAITDYVEIKVKDMWINEPHNELFYSNFFDIIQIVNSANIKYSNIININSVEELIKIDKLL